METHLSQSSRFALALFLGLLAGFASGWNLTFAVLLLLVLALDVPLRWFLPTSMASAGLAWVCMPVSYHVGRLALDYTPCGACLAALGDSTLVALFDWDRYVIAGGIVTAVLIGVPLVWAADWALDAWLARPLLDDQKSQRRWFRPEAWRPRWRRHAPGYVLAGVACIGIAWLLAPRFAAERLLRELAVANRAEVNAGAAQYSLLSGVLSIDSLELADPAELGQNRLTAARVTAQLSPGPWLRGRYLLDDVRLQGVAAGTPRRQVSPRPASGSRRDPATPSSSGVTELPLASNLRTWERLQPQLKGLEVLLTQLAALADSQRCAEPAKPGWLFADRGRLSRLRSNLGAEQPRVVIRSLQADELTASCGLGEKAIIELKGFTSLSHPEDEPAQLTIVAPQRGCDLTARLNFESAGGKHEVRFRLFDVSLADLAPHYVSGGCLFVDRGRISLTGQGWASSNRFDVAIQFKAEDFGIYVSGPQMVAGLTPALWTAGLSCLDEFRGEVALRGPWDAPRLVVDHQKLIGHFDRQLRAAGAHEYVGAIAEQTAPGYQPQQLAVADKDEDGTSARATDRVDAAAPVLVAPGQVGAFQQPSPPPADRITAAAIPALAARPPSTQATESPGMATAVPVTYPDTGYAAIQGGYRALPKRPAVEPPGPINLAIGYDADFVQAQASQTAMNGSTEARPAERAAAAVSPAVSTSAEEAFDPVPQFQPATQTAAGGSTWTTTEAGWAFGPPPATEAPAATETEPSFLSRVYQGTIGRFQRSAEPVEAPAAATQTADSRLRPTGPPEEPRQAARPWYSFGRK